MTGDATGIVEDMLRAAPTREVQQELGADPCTWGAALGQVLRFVPREPSWLYSRTTGVICANVKGAGASGTPYFRL
jgi:hypothetical protein